MHQAFAECKIETSIHSREYHTTKEHGASRAKAKFIKLKDKVFICEAVRICPNQTAKESMCNVASSPTKTISINKIGRAHGSCGAPETRPLSFVRSDRDTCVVSCAVLSKNPVVDSRKGS